MIFVLFFFIFRELLLFVCLFFGGRQIQNDHSWNVYIWSLRMFFSSETNRTTYLSQLDKMTMTMTTMMIIRRNMRYESIFIPLLGLNNHICHYVKWQIRPFNFTRCFNHWDAKCDNSLALIFRHLQVWVTTAIPMPKWIKITRFYELPKDNISN